MTRLGPIAVAIVLLCSANGWADSVGIISGTATVDPLGGPGPRLTVTFTGDLFSASMRWLFPTIPCPTGCRAGSLVTLSTTARESHINVPPAENVAVGSAGSYTNLAFAGELVFSGPAFTLPPVPAVPATELPVAVLLAGPFSFRGTVSGYRVLDVREEQLLFTEDMFGLGTARARFLGGPGQTYALNELTYEFAPVPEPGTLLLLGSGLAAAWLGRRHVPGHDR